MIMRSIWKTGGGYAIYVSIGLLLLACFGIRSQYDVIVYYDTDTVSYFYASQRILQGIIDPIRPPVYPLLLKVFTVLYPRDPFPAVVLFQGIVSFLSIVPFYLVCRRWLVHQSLAFLASLVYACYPILHAYNGSVFPESFLVVCYVWLLFLFSGYVANPTPAGAWALNTGLVVMVLLKPGSLYLYGVFALIWFIKVMKERLAVRRAAVISYVVAVALILGYCQLNSDQNGCFGLSTVTHDNNFGNVIYSGLYRNIPDQQLVTAIDSSMKNGVYYTIYYLNNDHDFIQQQYKNFPYINNSNMNYVLGIPSSGYGYTKSMLDRYLRKVMYSGAYVGYIVNNTGVFADSTVFGAKGYMIIILNLLWVGLIVYMALKNGVVLCLDIFVVAAAGGMVCTFLIAGFGQSERILLPVLPLFIFQGFRFLDLLVHATDLKKLATQATVKQF